MCLGGLRPFFDFVDTKRINYTFFENAVLHTRELERVWPCRFCLFRWGLRGCKLVFTVQRIGL